MGDEYTISCHVLDTVKGLPASGIAVICCYYDEGEWSVIGEGITNENGRVSQLLSPQTLARKILTRQERNSIKLQFKTEAYQLQHMKTTFFDNVEVSFSASPHQTHYHIPLLLSHYSYTVYRGS